MKRGNARALLRGVRRALIAALGALLLMNAASAHYADPTGLTVSVSLRLPAREGRTVLELPPLGEVDARTHALPVELRLRLDRIEPVTLQTLAESPSRESLAAMQERILGFLHTTMVHFAMRQVVLGGVGALGTLYLAGVRRPAALALGGAGAAAALALAGAAVYWQFDVDAFAAPRYRGVLRAAPQVVEAARMGVEAVRGVGRRLQRSADQLASIYRRLQQAAPVVPPGDELVVAHVSDLHNNPVGFDLLEAVVEHFGVDVVIDTGDMLDIGSDLEPILTERIQALGVPYLYAAGNHDTPRLLATLRGLPNVTVLDGEPVEVAGLRVLGFADPGSRRDDPDPLSEAEIDEMRRLVVEAIRAAGRERIDIVAVHNYRLGRSLPPGIASAVVFGHDHRLALEVREGTAYVDAGSTGAEGLRGLERDELRPFTLALLRFDLSEGRPRLWAVDGLSLDALSGELSLERRLVAPPAPDEASGPSVQPDEGEKGGQQGEGARRVEPKQADASKPAG